VRSGPVPADVPSLLQALVASDPGRPRLTWYGHGGERVELSARVLDNWVAKTANLLVEELDAGPGSAVRLDLPMHWRTAVWALAVWAVGGDLAEPMDATCAGADVVVTGAVDAAPSGAPDAGRLVAVALPALARSVPSTPPGALDYNAEVSGFGDVFVAEAPTALPAGLRRWPDQVRLLVTPSTWDLRDAVLAPLAVDGSVVLSADEPVPASLLDAEQVTARA
jgi:uncharacterized protein (TIGR03089 family)